MPRNRNNKRDQYKEAICTLNTKLIAKLTQLEKKTCYCEELEKTATNLMTELAALHEQMDKAKANTMAVFQISQPFFDECEVYYGDRFDDYLKQVVAIYLDLDLPQVSIDDTVPLTP